MSKFLNTILDMKQFPPAERIETGLSFLTNKQQILVACSFVKNTPLRGGGTTAGLLSSGACRFVIEATRNFALGETSKDTLKVEAEVAWREWGSAEEHAEYERKRPDNEERANHMLAYANACHAATMVYGWQEDPGTTTPHIATLAAEYAAIAVAYDSSAKLAHERDRIRDETLEAQVEMLRRFIEAQEDEDEDIHAG